MCFTTVQFLKNQHQAINQFPNLFLFFFPYLAVAEAANIDKNIFVREILKYCVFRNLQKCFARSC